MPTKCEKVTLRIGTNESSVQFITDALNVLPERCIIKGGFVSKSDSNSPKHHDSAWILTDTLNTDASLDQRIFKLVHLIESNLENYLKIKNRITSVDLYLLIDQIGEQGGLVFTSDCIGKLALIGAEINLDIYVNK